MLDNRLSALDASFLQIENARAPMSVGGADLFTGPPPSYDELCETIESRLPLLLGFRQRVIEVPFGLGQPRWEDDPHFRLSYHLRHTALPAPGTVEQLQTLCARVMEQPLDRARALWELWLVEGLEDGRFALIHKMHHTLVDGIASIDVLNTLLDSSAKPDQGPAPESWEPEPGPSAPRLLVDAVLERAMPPEVIRSVGEIVRAPRQAAGWGLRALAGAGALGRTAADAAPPTPYNHSVGPHRRFAWQRESLDDFKAVKNALDGSLNDLVLASVAGALGSHLRRHGEDAEGLELQVFVPVALRSPGGDEGGNQVSGLRVPLPVGISDPLERFRRIHATMDELKDSAQVMGMRAALELSGLAPPALGDRLTSLGDGQRFVNLVITNVPGPQEKLYLLGRELEDIFPLLPLGANLGLGVAIVSYADHIYFGFSADPDLAPDVGELPGYLHASLSELADAADIGVTEPAPAASGSASAADGQPWPGYDDQTVAEISRTVAELDSDARDGVLDYERGHKDRKGVRRAVESAAG